MEDKADSTDGYKPNLQAAPPVLAERQVNETSTPRTTYLSYIDIISCQYAGLMYCDKPFPVEPASALAAARMLSGRDNLKEHSANTLPDEV